MVLVLPLPPCLSVLLACVDVDVCKITYLPLDKLLKLLSSMIISSDVAICDPVENAVTVKMLTAS